MTTLTSTKTFIPGAPSGNVGPSHAPSHLDHMPVPGSGTVGSMPTEVFRRLCHRMEIPDSHAAGRLLLLERYAALLLKKHKAAGDVPSQLVQALIRLS